MPIDINTGCSGDESEGNSENESFQKAESNGGYNHFSIEANLRTVPFAGVLVVVLLLVLLIGLDSAEPLGQRLQDHLSSSWTLMKALLDDAGAEPNGIAAARGLPKPRVANCRLTHRMLKETSRIRANIFSCDIRESRISPERPWQSIRHSPTICRI